jgi:hypothetical protein
MAKFKTTLLAACKEVRCVAATLLAIAGVGCMTVLLSLAVHVRLQYGSPVAEFIVDHKMVVAAIMFIWFATAMVLIWRKPIEQIVKS